MGYARAIFLFIELPCFRGNLATIIVSPERCDANVQRHFDDSPKKKKKQKPKKSKQKKKILFDVRQKATMAGGDEMVQPALGRILPLILALSGQGSKLAAARYLYRNSVIYDLNPPPRELFLSNPNVLYFP